MRWPISEPTLRSDPAASPGVCATATAESDSELRCRSDSSSSSGLLRKGGAVRLGYDDYGMSQNFIACDREQVLLLPPNLSEWLPEDHVAWLVLAAAEEMDLSAFYASYRSDGHGRAAHEPAMMVGLLVYAYARGQRSSRRIERSCIEDVGYRVIAANQVPDHTTIARFRTPRGRDRRAVR